VVPFALTIWISLLKWRANRPFETARFAGLENYEAVLTNDQFWLALGRTFYFAGVAVALELIIGFVLAMLVSRCTRSRQLYTTIFLVPMMIVPIVVGYNFSMIYIDSGPLNQILAPSWSDSALIRASAGCRIRSPRSGDHHRRRLAVDVADVPYLPVRLRCVTASARERGPRDGRIALADVLAVELPLLKPAIVIAVIIRSMEALKLFDPVVLLTFGGPAPRRRRSPIFLWEQVWVFNKFSFGAAASILLLVIFSILIFFGVYMLISQRRAVEGSAP
jgi:multiple sugar transport system permease protein